MEQVRRKRVKRGICLGLMLLGLMLSLSSSAQEEKVLKVTFDGTNLSVTAVNAGAEELLQAMAREVKFKLTTAGISPTLKADVNFENVPLGKAIDRVIRALRIKSNVSHVAVYEKQGEKDVLYSLRVTGSSGGGPPPMGPPGKAEKMAPRPPPLPPPQPAPRKAPGEQEEAEQKRRLRREMEENILKKLREEGLTEEEIMERLRGLLREGE